MSENNEIKFRIQKTGWSYNDSICPFCKAHVKSIVGDTLIEINVSPTEVSQKLPTLGSYASKREDDQLMIQYIRCIYCNKISYRVYDYNQNKWFPINPNSTAKIFPDIPPKLYKDYSEACEILYLSPNASATLSRRCLQAMIKDRWGIEREKIAAQITSISSDNISKLERKALEALKDIANFGAHPNEIVEVSVEDAAKSIQIIEFFFKKWYIDDPAEEKMLTEIVERKAEMKIESSKKST